MRQRFAAALAVLFLSPGLWAQTTLATNAGAPSSSAAGGAPVTILPAAPSAVIVPATAAPKPKLFDAKFSIWMAASFAATVADIESTQHGIATCNLVEVNPILGRTPSRARMYAIGLPVTAGYNLLGLWAKRHAPHRRLWMLMPGTMTVVHGGAAAHNYALCH